MKRPIARHDWLLSACRVDAGLRDDAAAHRLLVDAHRQRRGPFTAASGVVRALIDDAIARTPELFKTHLMTLLLVAPEIAGCVEVPADVRDASAVSREGNPTSWMRRVANGVADFILGCFERRPAFPASLTFTNVDHADPADQEFIATLLRRADPGILRLCICTESDHLTPPLAAALGQFSRRRPQPRRRLRKTVLDDTFANLSTAERDALAREHVNADGASHRPLAEHAYRRLPAPERRAMHLARAEQLGRLDEPSLALGAIPFHHEQAGGDAATLLAASRSCLDMGCYDAALDWAVRGRAMLAHAPQGKTFGELTRQMLFALLLLRRHDEVEGLCKDLLAGSTDPALLAHATYAMAILNARHYERSRRDYDAAKSWIEKSQAFTDAMPASQTRAVNAAFLMNTLALVQMRKGHADLARQTLVDALALMAREAPDLYRNESAILLHNMARLAVTTGNPDLAIGHLSTLLSQQPGDSSAWFDRGLIHQRAGRHDAALRDYDAAIQWEPAHTEAHFNRAQSLAALGRRDEAIDGYERVIVLEPDYADARLNRAILLCERGDLASARDEIMHVMQIQPNDARIHGTLGLIAMATGDPETACTAFARAIELDPALADPWANRAIIAYRRGDISGARRDLTEALARREDAVILCNRAKVFEAERRWQEAADDYARAMTLQGADREAIGARRARCLDAIGQPGRRLRPKAAGRSGSSASG